MAVMCFRTLRVHPPTYLFTMQTDEGVTQEEQRASYEKLVDVLEKQQQQEQPEGGAASGRRERILGLACDLLGNHAAVVPSMVLDAVSALVSLRCACVCGDVFLPRFLFHPVDGD